MTAEQLRAGDDLVRQAMVATGVAPSFIERALAKPSGDMWYPSVDELRAAGVITKEDAPLKTFAANMVSFLDNVTNAGGFKPEATGHEDIDRITKTFAEFSRRWSDLFVEMKAELEQTGEPNVYSDQTLLVQKKIREALSIQSKRKQIVEQYRSKAYEETRWLANECAAMKPSDATAKGMIKGMNHLAETGRAQSDQLLNLVSDEEVAKERFLSFMLETFSDYKLVNSKISFSKQADVERYRALGKALTDSSKALEEFRAEMLKSVDASKEKLKKLAH
jgi:hypothetical protein